MSNVLAGITLLKEGATIPVYASTGSSGFDLVSLEYKVLDPHETHLFKLGWAIVLPPFTELQIRSRSGIAGRLGLAVLNQPGTVDSDYRDEVGILLHNFGTLSQKIDMGDRIAQGVIAPVYRADFRLKDEVDRTIDRGGGLGHTGIRRALGDPRRDPMG